MSAVVIDASMVLSWLLPDEAADPLDQVRNGILAAETIWVAGHWHLEVCNSLWVAEKRRRLDASGISQAVTLLGHLPVVIDPETSDRAGSETLALARQHALSVYDAAYLELALRRGAALASLDDSLRDTAKQLGVELLPGDLSGKS